MRLGVQFRANVPARATRGFFTHSWPEAWRVLWLVVPTAPVQDAAPQIEWNVKVERQAANLLKYYIYITNVSGSGVDIEARYAILE